MKFPIATFWFTLCLTYAVFEMPFWSAFGVTWLSVAIAQAIVVCRRNAINNRKNPRHNFGDYSRASTVHTDRVCPDNR